ncbi:hypothetical protein D3C80_1490680 [compost metagenome]
MMGKRQQGSSTAAGYSSFNCQAFIGFDRMNQAFGRFRYNSNRHGDRSILVHFAIDLNTGIIRQKIKNAPVRNIQCLNITGIIIQRVHQPDCGFRVIGSSALLQLLRLFGQLLVLVQLEQLILQSLHRFCPCLSPGCSFLLLRQNFTVQIEIFQIIGRNRLKC